MGFDVEQLRDRLLRPRRPNEARQESDPGFDKLSDASSYDRHAQTYERYVDQLGGPLADRICDLAEIAPGDRILDVGCGSGVSTRRAAERTGAEGSVVGIDLSRGMVDSACAQPVPAGAARTDYLVMDAEALDLEAASFDVVISLCAVLHFPAIASALSECRRVLRPGGRLVVAFGKGRPSAPIPLVAHAVRRGMRTLRRPFRPELRAPDALIAEIGRELPPPEQPLSPRWTTAGSPRRALLREIQAAGFAAVSETWAGHELRFSSAEEFAEAQLSIVTFARKQLESAPPQTRAAINGRLVARAQGTLDRGGELVYPYGAFFVTADAPLDRVPPTQAHGRAHD